MTISERTNRLKNHARELGFMDVGISMAQFMDVEAIRLEQWLNSSYQGKMSYMERHFDKRVDPRKLVEGAKSVVSLSYNYYSESLPLDPEAPQMAKYAYGEDYHHVIKDKLKSLLQVLQTEIGDIHGRCFVDSAPILERDWAQRSGVGWIGKNTLLLSKKRGSFFFLAELILDVEFEYDHPVTDHCGECTRCIDACPTEAISPKGYVLDASKCISYLTIELREDIPQEFKGKMENWMFGCDICQDVCPWNRFSVPHQEALFEPKNELLNMTKRKWQDITKEVFNNLFRHSAVKRTKYEGLKRNIDFLND